MKYIRTKYGKIGTFISEELGYAFHTYNIFYEYWKPNNEAIVKQANTIEELFDRYVVIQNVNNNRYVYTPDKFVKRVKRNKTYSYEHDSYPDRLKDLLEYNKIYGAIWTDKGLIYKAKMRGVLSNGEIDWELL